MTAFVSNCLVTRSLKRSIFSIARAFPANAGNPTSNKADDHSMACFNDGNLPLYFFAKSKLTSSSGSNLEFSSLFLASTFSLSAVSFFVLNSPLSVITWNSTHSTRNDKSSTASSLDKPFIVTKASSRWNIDRATIVCSGCAQAWKFSTANVQILQSSKAARNLSSSQNLCCFDKPFFLGPLRLSARFSHNFTFLSAIFLFLSCNDWKLRPDDVFFFALMHASTMRRKSSGLTHHAKMHILMASINLSSSKSFSMRPMLLIAPPKSKPLEKASDK
mmetsp:Transcript_8742/g.25479  ORF Transcript_8742/g.25479 Transcript_8742/m.25479 type:complete len:275 (-) Transcript_8742:701-1525(-)